MRPELRNVPGLDEALPGLLSSLLEDGSPRNVMRVAEAFLLTGAPEQAIELLEPLIERDPTSIAGRVLLAWCYDEDGQEEESARLLAEVDELDPANPYGEPASPDAPAPLAPVREAPVSWEPHPLATVTSGEPSEPPEVPEPEDRFESEAEPEPALTVDELRGIPPTPLYSVTLAELFERQGFEEKAVEIYREVLRANPQRGDLRPRIVTLEDRLAGSSPG